MSHSGLTTPIAYSDIPDLDSGRIPFPMSKEDHYAIGERKTVLVFSPEIVDESLLDQSIRSLLETLQSPTNRLYLDIVLFSSYSSEVQEIWKHLFATLSDCSILFLPKTPDPWSSQLNSYLESEHVEQLIFVTVSVSVSINSSNPCASPWMPLSTRQLRPIFSGTTCLFTA